MTPRTRTARLPHACLALALALSASGALAQAAPAEVTLTRLECGNAPAPVSVAAFNDTYATADLKLQLTYSCYLVRRGDAYLVWDTGNPMGAGPTAPKVSLVDQLARLGVTPGQVKYVGVSHYHGDHTGQAASLPGATLLVGKGDWDVIAGASAPAGMTAEAFEKMRAPFAPWRTGGGAVEAVGGDKKDVFGDGRVVMLSLPGHTPGHFGLLVRLKDMGNVLLTGDTTHFHENYAIDGVPTWNTNRADTLASLDRFKKIAATLKATVIIQHDPRDVAKLPAFPKAAR